MTKQFTKGEWKVKHSQSKDAFNVIGTVLGGKYKIARCPYVLIPDSKTDINAEKEEAAANARLIAAAPDLLEAAMKVRNAIAVNLNAKNKEAYDLLNIAIFKVLKIK